MVSWLLGGQWYPNCWVVSETITSVESMAVIYQYITFNEVINHIELSKLRKSVNKDIDSVKKCVSRYIVTFDCTKYLHLMQINVKHKCSVCIWIVLDLVSASSGQKRWKICRISRLWSRIKVGRMCCPLSNNSRISSY